MGEDTPAHGSLDVVVKLADGRRFQVAFYDTARLGQTLDDCAAEGAVHYSEPGLVVLKEVNTDNVRRAAAALVEGGFFESLKPLT